VLPLRPFTGPSQAPLIVLPSPENTPMQRCQKPGLSPQLPHAIVQAHLADAGGPARVIVVLDKLSHADSAGRVPET
jgi:hypothetical protein